MSSEPIEIKFENNKKNNPSPKLISAPFRSSAGTNITKPKIIEVKSVQNNPKLKFKHKRMPLRVFIFCI